MSLTALTGPMKSRFDVETKTFYYFVLSVQDVQKLLKKRGWTASRLALQLNVNKSTVSLWMNGKRKPKMQYAEMIYKMIKDDDYLRFD